MPLFINHKPETGEIVSYTECPDISQNACPDGCVVLMLEQPPFPSPINAKVVDGIVTTKG